MSSEIYTSFLAAKRQIEQQQKDRESQKAAEEKLELEKKQQIEAEKDKKALQDFQFVRNKIIEVDSELEPAISFVTTVFQQISRDDLNINSFPMRQIAYFRNYSLGNQPLYNGIFEPTPEIIKERLRNLTPDNVTDLSKTVAVKLRWGYKFGPSADEKKLVKQNGNRLGFRDPKRILYEDFYSANIVITKNYMRSKDSDIKDDIKIKMEDFNSDNMVIMPLIAQSIMHPVRRYLNFVKGVSNHTYYTAFDATGNFAKNLSGNIDEYSDRR